MCRGDADEAVVAVKLVAEEGMVTCPRGKPPESDMDVGGEGRNRRLVTLTTNTHRREGSGRKTAPLHGAGQRRQAREQGTDHAKHGDAQRKGNVEQGELFTATENLFEQLCTLRTLYEGFKAVKRNGGSPGIDGVTIKAFEARLQEELGQLKRGMPSGGPTWLLVGSLSAAGLGGNGARSALRLRVGGG